MNPVKLVKPFEPSETREISDPSKTIEPCDKSGKCDDPEVGMSDMYFNIIAPIGADEQDFDASKLNTCAD